MAVPDTHSPSPPGRLARLADLAYRRRGRTVLVWIALLAAVIALVPFVAGSFGAEFATPGSDSKAASGLIAERFPGRSGESVDVVWRAEAGARAPEVQARVDRFLAEAAQLEGIAAAGEPRVSQDGLTAILSLELDRPALDVPVDTGKSLIALGEQAGGDGLQLALGGAVIRNAEDGGAPEIYGIIAAALVLLVAFGSVVAAGLPLVTALVALGISTSLIGVTAAVMDVPDFAPAVAGLIGIGVGIDYALLIVTRFRSALDAGLDPRAATVEAVSTAGRSALVAGGTVCISILGLFFIGVSFLRGVAVSASLAVLVVMAASVTLLPALLGFLGHRVDRLRIPGLGRARRADADTDTVSARWSRAVQRRPVVAAILGAAVLLLLAAPVLGLRLGFPDAGNDPAGTPTRTAYDLRSEAFGPGSNGPLIVAVDLAGAGAGRAGASDALVRELRQTPGVAFVPPARPSADGSAALVTVIPTTSPQSEDTTELIDRLRDEVAPRALEGTGAIALVGGVSAAFVDQSALISERLPIFVIGVVGLSFLLLLLAFRAPVVALKAGVMNLLSIGAAYGVIALFADGGWLGGLIGIDEAVPVAPFIPVMMFAILFGLSMDYEVFLLSRVREEYLRHGITGKAVTDGLARTARVITAAAAIMVVVFLAFVFSSEVFLRLMGVGMATAVLVDATIVRMVLAPAVMQLMGRANWWIPRWLDRALPRLDGEPAVPAPAQAPGPSAPVTSER